MQACLATGTNDHLCANLYPNHLKKEAQGYGTSLLREMQKQGGGQEPKGYRNEKQETCNHWHLPQMWDEGVSNRKGLS